MPEIDTNAIAEQSAEEALKQFGRLTPEQETIVRQTARRATQLVLLSATATPDQIEEYTSEIAALRATLSTLAEVKALELPALISGSLMAVIDKGLDRIFGPEPRA